VSRRIALSLLAALSFRCAEPPRDAPRDAAAADASQEPEVPGEASEPPADRDKAAVPKQRAAWLPDIDEVARVYPAHGVAQYHMAHVYEAPRKDSRPVGYLRRGARFRASEEVTRAGCTRGWFEVYGGGYVCNGEGVTVDSQPPLYDDAPRAPLLAEPLPYGYAKVTAADVPQFSRIPTPEEEQAARRGPVGNQVTLNAAGVPVVDALPRELASIVRGKLQPGFYVSLDRKVEGETQGRKFVRTVRGGHLRSEGLLDGKLPAGIGVALGQHYALPLAITYRPGTPNVRLDPKTHQFVRAGTELPSHAAYSLTGSSMVVGGMRYYETRDGRYLRASSVRVIAKVPKPRPVPKGERWIRVDLDRQTLTAYEGDTPVFATLVSSGTQDHATPVGVYRINAKHVATTMADDLAADGPYSIEDVPWTMYFLGSYALHAAFWHDRFGMQRSHGCVNLAPRDARWLFFWTLPELPSAWHGVLAGVGQGTSVSLDTGVAYPIEQGG
jgi:lipoprotein-anchoring transpeptidase ErfK/SrfK